MNAARAALLALCAWTAPAQPRLDYPLAPKTRWTYRLRQEIGAGAHFRGEDAKKAHGNVLESTVIGEVAGVDTIGGRRYTRVEHLRDGKPWLFEWYRITPAGLMVGKTVNYESGVQEVVMDPEQKRIGSVLRPKEFWYWQAKDAPLRFRYDVIGPEEIEVPAGHYSAVHLTSTGTLSSPAGTITIKQDTWFVPGVGIAKQDTNTTLPGRPLSHVVLTLEKFEKP